MWKWILIAILLIPVAAAAVTVYDYASGLFVVIPDTANPTFQSVTVSTLTSTSSTTVSNATANIISRTLAQIGVLTLPAGTPVYCSNCVTDALCVSTGTIGGFVRNGARTIACQ